MAFDAIKGSLYRGSTNPIPKSDIRMNETNIQDIGAVNRNVTKAPVAKTSGDQKTGQEQNQGQRDPNVTEQHVKSAISQVNSRMKQFRTRCEFSYHEVTNRVSIKVLDRDTEEVIREIPPEEALEMIEKMWELAGLLIDEKR